MKARWLHPESFPRLVPRQSVHSVHLLVICTSSHTHLCTCSLTYSRAARSSSAFTPDLPARSLGQISRYWPCLSWTTGLLSPTASFPSVPLSCLSALRKIKYLNWNYCCCLSYCVWVRYSSVLTYLKLLQTLFLFIFNFLPFVCFLCFFNIHTCTQLLPF